MIITVVYQLHHSPEALQQSFSSVHSGAHYPARALKQSVPTHSQKPKGSNIKSRLHDLKVISKIKCTLLRKKHLLSYSVIHFCKKDTILNLLIEFYSFNKCVLSILIAGCQTLLFLGIEDLSMSTKICLSRTYIPDG